jgi:hypothetical protein
MKKRFFAGLLACLMVVGLLPLSMLLKPVSAKANTNEAHIFDATKIGSTMKDGMLVDDYFTVSGDATKFGIKESEEKNTGETWKCFRFNGATKYDKKTKLPTKNYIKFTADKDVKITIKWMNINGSTRSIKMLDSSAKEVLNQEATSEEKNCAKEITYKTKKEDTYYIGNGGADVLIYSIEVEPMVKFDVMINDSKSTETGNINLIVEGETFTLKAADTTNFLYWVNSYGRIVSRDAEYSFPVYYSDTYTAVYKSADTTYNFMTDYDQIYKTYTASDLAIPTSPVKYGYEFNYWKIGETKVSTVEEIKAAGADTDVVIKPVYKEITENVSITINGVSKEYKKNEVVTADATALENFMYWHVTGDESKILSYNDLYYFYADDKINSITAKCGTDTVEKSGIITHVTSYSYGDSKTFVFEFTVPDGCTIEFAGVVASSTSTEPTLTDYEYIRGRSSSARTYRYSWTKLNASNTTWNVRPILKYSDGQGNIMTIDTSTVQSL